MLVDSLRRTNQVIGQELIIQPSTADILITQNAPDGNYIGIDFIGTDPLINHMGRSILRFDFSSLPDGKTITAATVSLYMYTYSTHAPQGRTFWLYEITQTGWIENQVTWNSYKTGSTWGFSGGDYTVTNGSSMVCPALPPLWVSWDILALAQHFQSAHGKVANLLLRDGTENTAQQYLEYIYSRRYVTDPSLHPKLTITYS
jgi:hypothetical protein